jgi:hypothetical protein
LLGINPVAHQFRYELLLFLLFVIKLEALVLVIHAFLLEFSYLDLFLKEFLEFEYLKEHLFGALTECEHSIFGKARGDQKLKN